MIGDLAFRDHVTTSIGNSNMKINCEKTVKVGQQTLPCIYAYCRRGCDGNCNFQSRLIPHSDAGVRCVVREDAGAHAGSLHPRAIELERRNLARSMADQSGTPFAWRESALNDPSVNAAFVPDAASKPRTSHRQFKCTQRRDCCAVHH